LEIFYLKSVDSTHTYIKNYLKQNSYTKPICFYTQNQTSGIGSRDNSWDGKEGNLFFSFAIDLNSLPQDIPIQSFSIYFSYILKQELEKLGSKVWLKWPNDFYIDKYKFGGTITTLQHNILICGIGINLKKVNDKFQGYLDIEVDIKKLLQNYFDHIKKSVSWKQIFSLFEVEFHKNKNFTTTIQGEKISLNNSILNEDGSILIDNKKVYSLR
jgi:BirA family biotin operon repressor/biotin-[acetyl-CoA-carboxylase] ligase